MEYIDKCHQYLVQFMLKNGSSKIRRALDYCSKISNEDIPENQLGVIINQINRIICNQYFKIVKCKCEVSGDEFLVWVNMKNDALSKLQINYTERELEYFQAILKEITISDERKIMYVVCINITSTLSGNFSRVKGQNVLVKWISGGYFVKCENFIYLGPRLLQEFATYLKSLRPECICYLCSEVAFTGKICSSCDKIFHSYCIESYLQSQISCPSCKKYWNSTDKFNYITPGEDVAQDSDSDESMHDESTPGTSRSQRS